MRSIASIGSDFEHARNQEVFEPSRAWMKLLPTVDGEIDHGEPGGRKFFPQPLAIVRRARRDQQRCQFLQAGVMTDNQKRMDALIYAPHHVEDRCRCRFV